MWRGKFASKIVDVLDEGVGEGEGDDDVGFAVQKTLSKEVLDVFRSIREELRESEAMMENAVDGSAIDMEENPVTVIPGYQVGRVDFMFTAEGHGGTAQVKRSHQWSLQRLKCQRKKSQEV